MTSKRFHVELYGNDDLLVREWVFDRKAEQLEKYYQLISKGYRRDNIIKETRTWYC